MLRDRGATDVFLFSIKHPRSNQREENATLSTIEKFTEQFEYRFLFSESENVASTFLSRQSRFLFSLSRYPDTVICRYSSAKSHSVGALEGASIGNDKQHEDYDKYIRSVVRKRAIANNFPIRFLFLYSSLWKNAIGLLRFFESAGDSQIFTEPGFSNIKQ